MFWECIKCEGRKGSGTASRRRCPLSSLLKELAGEVGLEEGAADRKWYLQKHTAGDSLTPGDVQVPASGWSPGARWGIGMGHGTVAGQFMPGQG